MSSQSSDVNTKCLEGSSKEDSVDDIPSNPSSLVTGSSFDLSKNTSLSLPAGISNFDSAFLLSSLRSENKDNKYWDRRKKNNEAARRSREKRRLNDQALSQRIQELMQENESLKGELSRARSLLQAYTTAAAAAAAAASVVSSAAAVTANSSNTTENNMAGVGTSNALTQQQKQHHPIKAAQSSSLFITANNSCSSLNSGRVGSSGSGAAVMFLPNPLNSTSQQQQQPHPTTLLGTSTTTGSTSGGLVALDCSQIITLGNQDYYVARNLTPEMILSMTQQRPSNNNNNSSSSSNSNNNNNNNNKLSLDTTQLTSVTSISSTSTVGSIVNSSQSTSTALFIPVKSLLNTVAAGNNSHNTATAVGPPPPPTPPPAQAPMPVIASMNSRLIRENVNRLNSDSHRADLRPSTKSMSADSKWVTTTHTAGEAHPPPVEYIEIDCGEGELNQEIKQEASSWPPPPPSPLMDWSVHKLKQTTESAHKLPVILNVKDEAMDEECLPSEMKRCRSDFNVTFSAGGKSSSQSQSMSRLSLSPSAASSADIEPYKLQMQMNSLQAEVEQLKSLLLQQNNLK